MPNRYSGDGAREAREAHNLDSAGLDSRPRNQPSYADLICNPYRPCTCGVAAADPRAADPKIHKSTCQYVAWPDPRRQSVPDPFAEELEASRQDRQDR